MPATVGAQLHPFGNKGPDLIETIRLERQSGPHVRIIPHPAVHPERHASASHSDYRRMWAEPRWDRPHSAAASVRVHAPTALHDLLGGASKPRLGEAARSPSQASQSAASRPASSCSRSTNNRIAAQRRSCSASLHSFDRASLRLQETMQAQQDSQDKLALRVRLKHEEAAAKAEADFHRGWEAIMEGKKKIEAPIVRSLELREADRLRKAGVLYRNWNNDVFNRIQEQVEKEVNRRERDGVIQSRWRKAQEEYIKALEGKEKGLFRDTVIEDEYDPFEFSTQHIKYSSKDLKDPLKFSLLERQEEELLAGTPHTHAVKHDTRLPVTLWSKLEASPYGHYAQMEASQNKSAQAIPQRRSLINMDHYNFETGPEVVNREFHKPKRTFNCKR